ncbi:MAG: hypothetical protein H6825_02275 [Planctomycetes bacterium]|nr:hypothetical protein [Planctomycetota bacterium]
MSLAQPLEFLLVVVATFFGVWLVVKLLMGVGWALSQGFRAVGTIVGRLGAFVGGMLRDAMRLVGGGITAACFVPAIVLNVALGRWSRANHFGRALEREAAGVASAAYRLAIGHAARLFGLHGLTDGIERRLPEVIARAPGPDAPRPRSDAFPGYRVVGSLPSGGSGARLFLAEPDDDRRALLARSGMAVPRRVVIKSFSLGEGSTMPQIVRESRALEAARQLGLVLEHDLTQSRFHYVMPYVPGDDLTVATQRLHDEAGPDGLGPRQVQKVMSYGADLLQIMHRFHSHGLWHKDIKPSNIIVSEGRVHLVDLGLITPLRSAMTLTTHGTEYFRDPELVRLALRGVKVHEVDGVKFDIYGAGAVLYSMIENSFPAHGSLSQISRRCPEALRWIVRRAMADMGKRYESSLEMLADLRALMTASDPFAFAPANLPSMRAGAEAAGTTAAAASSFGPDAIEAGPRLRDVHTSPPPGASVPAGRPGDDSTREGLRWGAAAGLLFTMAASALVAFLFVRTDGFSHGGGVADTWAEITGRHEFSPPSPRPAAPTTRSPTLPDPGRAVSRSGDARAAGATASGASADRATPASASGGTNSSGIVSSVAATPAAAVAAQLAGHRGQPHTLLVIDDVKDSSGLRPAVEALFEDLDRARFALLTNDVGSDDDFAILAEAEARTTLGVSSVLDVSAPTLDRLSNYLTQQQARLQGILWVGAGRAPGALAARVLTLDEVDRDDVQRLFATHHDLELATSLVAVSDG